MKPLILAIAAIATVAAAEPQRRPLAPAKVDEIRADCPLTIRFGSYAMGIDGTAYDATVRLLTRDRGVTRVEQRNWGREGERTLCAMTRSRADARRLFGRVKALFPRKPRGPLTVSLRGGPDYHSPGNRR